MLPYFHFLGSGLFPIFLQVLCLQVWVLLGDRFAAVFSKRKEFLVDVQIITHLAKQLLASVNLRLALIGGLGLALHLQHDLAQIFNKLLLLVID